MDSPSKIYGWQFVHDLIISILILATISKSGDNSTAGACSVSDGFMIHGYQVTKYHTFTRFIYKICRVFVKQARDISKMYGLMQDYSISIANALDIL